MKCKGTYKPSDKLDDNLWGVGSVGDLDLEVYGIVREKESENPIWESGSQKEEPESNLNPIS